MLPNTPRVRVLFTYMEGPLADWENAFLPGVQEWLARQSRYAVEWTDSAQEADLIVFLEANSFKTQKYISTLRSNRFLRQFPGKCFTINYEDAPAGFLPGLYTCLPRVKYDPSRHRTWCYIFRPNTDFTERRKTWENPPRLLFSFRGSSTSNPVRERLFSREFKTTHPFRLTRIDKWFNHTVEEKLLYVDEILDSHFCLCPRGVGPGSIRLFEVMAAGRCPVIIADEWVAVEGIDWKSCSIQIAESALASIPEILAARLSDAPALGAAARRYWDALFSPENVLGESLNQLAQIARCRGADYDERNYQNLWRSRRFYKLNGWSLEDRIARKLSRFSSRWARSQARILDC